jgi:TRAP-type C4-dicarboxylate transport system permease small subunit
MMPQLTKSHSHVAITVLIERLTPRLQVRVYWAIFSACTVICATVTGISLLENVRQFTQDVHLMKNRPIPKWWISVFITYGFASTTIYFLRMLTPQRIRDAIAAKTVTVS